MTGLPWVKLAVDLPDSPQVVALARHAGVEKAVALGSIAALLCWVARFYPTGSVPAGDDGAALEEACRWAGKPGALVAAMVEAGVLTRRGGRYIFSKWRSEHAAHADRMERDRERMRAKRLKDREIGRATVAGRSSDGRGETERETEREKEIQTDSHSDTPPLVSDAPAAGRPGESSQEGKDQDPGLHRFRADLAARLKLPAIGVGKDREGVLAAFEHRIRVVGRDEVLAECVEAAGLSKNGVPANLAFFVGWLNTLPRPPEART